MKISVTHGLDSLLCLNSGRGSRSSVVRNPALRKVIRAFCGNRHHARVAVTAACGLEVFCAMAVANPPTFLLMPLQLAGNNSVQIVGISNDGTIIAGIGSCTGCGGVPSVGFSWNSVGNPTVISRPVGSSGLSVLGLSGDGTVVLGFSTGLSEPVYGHGWTWTAGGGFQFLVIPPGTRHGLEPKGMSSDGGVIAVDRGVLGVPSVNDGRDWYGAARYVDGATTQLTPLTYFFNGHSLIRENHAYGVSRDGSTVFGSSDTEATTGDRVNRAVKWTGTNLPQILPLLPGSPAAAGGYAFAASDSGSTIIGIETAPPGTPNSSNYMLAIRWRDGLAAEELPNPNTTGSRWMRPTGCSADGATVIGNYGASNAGGPGFIWTPENGTQDLRALAISLGAPVPSEVTLLNLQAISPDGLVIAGTTNWSTYQAFILNLRPTAATISHQPNSVQTCPSGGVMFSVGATGGGMLTYQWQWSRVDGDGLWTRVVDGANLGEDGSTLFEAVGANTPEVMIAPPTESGSFPSGVREDRIMTRCVVANAIGSVASDAAMLTVCACLECPADFSQDGGIDGADVAAFFAAWEGGDCTADVNADGGVDGSDVDTFFAAWEAGGCG